jgi:hypothetical protein
MSERASSRELAVNPAISRFKSPSKKNSLKAASGEWDEPATFVALVLAMSYRHCLVL